MIKKLTIGMGVTLVALSGMASADMSYTCKHDVQKRLIKVIYESAEAKVPCKVEYTKEHGEEPKILWDAQNQEGYCEEKAAAFVEKQKGWGWECAADAMEEAAAAEPAEEASEEAASEEASETTSEEGAM